MEDWVKAWEAAQPSSTHANHSLKQKLLLIALQSSPAVCYQAIALLLLLLQCIFASRNQFPETKLLLSSKYDGGLIELVRGMGVTKKVSAKEKIEL